MLLVTHFLLTNGIGQNVTAGLLMGIPGFLFARKHWRRHVAKLHQRLDKIVTQLEDRENVQTEKGDQ